VQNAGALNMPNKIQPREYSMGGDTEGILYEPQLERQPVRPLPLLERQQVELEQQLARQQLQR
jgi:hypothetical protein